MKYIHCSWDILEPDSLVPRVPETIITGPNLTEDSKTPRICVAGSVQDALKSIPGCGIMIRNMRKYFLLQGNAERYWKIWNGCGKVQKKHYIKFQQTNSQVIPGYFCFQLFFDIL